MSLDVEELVRRVAELEAENAQLRAAADKTAIYENVPAHRLEVFWSTVNKTDGCWLWTGKSDRFHVSKHRAVTPRRLVWRLHIGPLPVEVSMMCRVALCVNPAHMAQTEEQKFFALVDKSGPTVRHDLGPCWTWGGGINGKGYGVFSPRTGVSLPAHRYSYELANGPIGDSMLFVCHKCDNPECVNPEHHFLGTPKDNIQDMRRKGRGAGQPNQTFMHAKKPRSATQTGRETT